MPIYCNLPYEPILTRSRLLILPGLLVLALTLPQTGCAGSRKTTIPSYGEAKKRVLAGGPLVQQPIEKRIKLEGGKKQALKAGVVAPYTGVLLSLRKAEELVAVKAERTRLRKELEATRLQLGTSKIIYDAIVQRLKEEVRRSWWERNKGIVGLVLGIVVGGALVLGVMYAVTRGQGISTNSFVLQPVGVASTLARPVLTRW